MDFFFRKLYFDTQSGFRKGHSTETAFTSVTNYIITALDNKEPCAAHFVDLAKAFDSVNLGLLLQSLQHKGFSDTVFKWFANYLTGRTQCVSINSHNSASLEVKSGVPQGSISGTCVIQYLYKQPCLGLGQAKVHLYADDTIIYTLASSLQVAIFHSLHLTKFKVLSHFLHFHSQTTQFPHLMALFLKG